MHDRLYPVVTDGGSEILEDFTGFVANEEPVGKKSRQRSLAILNRISDFIKKLKTR